MLIAEFIIDGEAFDFFLFSKEDVPIAAKKFKRLVEENVFDDWEIQYKIDDRHFKIAPTNEMINYSDRPLTRVDHNVKPHHDGFLSFVGADENHVSDRLMVVLDNSTAKHFDGVCSPIGMIAVDHHPKLNFLKKGMKIDKITISDQPKEEIFARIPSFI